MLTLITADDDSAPAGAPASVRDGVLCSSAVVECGHAGIECTLEEVR